MVDAKEPQSQYAGFRELRSTLASGHRPSPKLRKAAGEWVRTKSGRLSRWCKYFAELLNIGLASVPSFAETLAAVRRLKPRKACGPDGLPGDVFRRLTLPNLRGFHEHVAQI